MTTRTYEISQVIELIQSAKDSGNLKTGANEVTKSINRGKAQLVILALNTEPIEIIGHIPVLCEDKSVTYIYVESKEALGKACGLERSVIACSVFGDTPNSINRNDTMIKKILGMWVETK